MMGTLAHLAMVLLAFLYLLVAGASESPAGTCLMGVPAVGDCTKADMGSCGNACCEVEVTTTNPPAKEYEKLKTYLSSGGGDGLFAYVTGPDPEAGSNNPPDNITSFSIATGTGSMWMYILKGKHTTFRKRFEDNLHIAIRTTPGGGAVVRMFSMSLVHGALGDGGQNYKTLAFLAQGAGLLVPGRSPAPIWGCGISASSMPVAAANPAGQAAAAARFGWASTLGPAAMLAVAAATAALLATWTAMRMGQRPRSGLRGLLLEA